MKRRFFKLEEILQLEGCSADTVAAKEAMTERPWGYESEAWWSESSSTCPVRQCRHCFSLL